MDVIHALLYTEISMGENTTFKKKKKGKMWRKKMPKQNMWVHGLKAGSKSLVAKLSSISGYLGSGSGDDQREEWLQLSRSTR